MRDDSPFDPGRLERLRAARRIGFVFSGGAARCIFQVGVLETLRELAIEPSLCVAVSAGAWNAAAVAAGAGHRLRSYWRAFMRMPRVDLTNLAREHSPFIFPELHRRTFRRYVGSERLRAPGALPLLVGATRLRDRSFVLFAARQVQDPLQLLLATNYLPPFYTHPPRLGGEPYGDGGMSNNLPYEAAFEAGCDAVVLMTMKGESEGGLFRGPRDPDHAIPASIAERVVVIRPRHRFPLSFNERRWPRLVALVELGRLRAREVLLGERHPATDLRAPGRAPSALFAGLLRQRFR
jgi:predicted acylesterase/phospholipase RssA